MSGPTSIKQRLRPERGAEGQRRERAAAERERVGVGPHEHKKMNAWIPILLMIGLGAGFGAFNILLSHLVGPKKPTPEKLAPYECGMPPVGDARERHPVKFYLVAMIFLLFDIEIAFLYPFAMSVRSLGWFGFVQIVVFFTILLAGYVYVWRKGVFDWGHERA
jgi:NADH-quinone oxidoreductase subunit A